MGSVKDLTILEKPTNTSPGRARFTFSDRYSVFDWGEMPDLIDHKGAAINLLAAYFFEKLEKMGVKSHYIGLVENDKAKRLSELKAPSNVMEINLLNVIKPGLVGDNYDYSMYKNNDVGFLIPLELIYRNSLPEGSSVFRRLERGSIIPQDLGLSEMPVPNQKFDPPLMDVSTKLEITDRYITWQEAQQISAMSEEEIQKIKELTININQLITDEFLKIGLVNEDGKIEVGFDFNRKLMLVDVLGTLDECRFTVGSMPVSKEIARIHYRNTPWHRATDEAKKKDRQRWKEICELQPDPLPEKSKTAISHVYCAVTNEITGREWFKDVPPLQNVITEIKELM